MKRNTEIGAMMLTGENRGTLRKTCTSATTNKVTLTFK